MGGTPGQLAERDAVFVRQAIVKVRPGLLGSEDAVVVS